MARDWTNEDMPTAPDSRVTVGHNDDGTLDEVVGTGDFHLEQMDTNAWWMQLGPHMVWLRARGKITAHFGENEALARGPQQAGGDGGCDHLNEVLAHISNGIDDIADDDHRALPQLREAWYHAGMAKAERDALQAEVARARNELSCCDDVPLQDGLAAGIASLREQRDALQAALREAGRDAERYRWLRRRNELTGADDPRGPFAIETNADDMIGHPNAADLDAAIDAALNGGQDDA